MVISHLRSAGQLDRLCTALILTPEASCLWLNSWRLWKPLPLSQSLLFCHLLFPSLVVVVVVVLLLQTETSWEGENPFNIHTHASVLFFAICLRACTLPSFLSCSFSLLLCLLSFLSFFAEVTLDSGTSWPRRKTGRGNRVTETFHKRKTDVGKRCWKITFFFIQGSKWSLSQKSKTIEKLDVGKRAFPKGVRMSRGVSKKKSKVERRIKIWNKES